MKQKLKFEYLFLLDYNYLDMNFYAFLPLIFLIINLHLLLQIFSGKEKGRDQNSAMFFYINGIIWLAFEFYNWLDQYHSLIILRLKLESIFWIFAGFWFLNFVFVFLKKKRNFLYYIILIYSSSVLIISLLTNLMIDGYTIYYWGTDLKPGHLFPYLGSTVNIIPILYSAVIIVFSLFKNENKKIKLQLNILLFGILLSIIISNFTDIIIPYIVKKDDFIHIASLTLIIPSISIFLTVKKRENISIRFDVAVNSLFNNMYDGVLIIDEHGYIVKINDSAIAIFNLISDDLNELKITHIIPDYNSEKNYYNYELDPDLYRKYISVSQSKIVIDNMAIGNILIIRDITEQKVLNSLWKRYEFIVDTVSDFMALVNMDRKYAIVNQAFCNAINRKQEDIINYSVSSIWGEKIYNNILKKHLNQAFGGEIVKYKSWINFGKSEKLFIEFIYYPYSSKDEITHVVVIGHDLTQQKLGEDIIQTSHIELENKVKKRTAELQSTNSALIEEMNYREKAEEELWNAHSRIQQLISSINSIIVGVSSDNKIMYFNSAAENLFELKSDEVVGNDINQVKIEWEIDKIKDAIKECLDKKSSMRLDLVSYERNDGKKRLLGLNINPILGRNNDIEGFLIWGIDITERKAIEAQLAQSQKLESIGELAAGIAHEINTPIQYIGDNLHFFNNSYVGINEIIEEYHKLIELVKSDEQNNFKINEILEKEKNIDLSFLLDEIPKAVTQSLEGVDRVSKIVKSMRDFSHPGMEEKTEIDINNALESTITISKNEWKYVADLETKLDHSIPLVPCYPGEINQVFLNIIINASHAIESTADKKGKIKITTCKVDNYVEIRISDTGTGIPDNIKDKVFDHFFTTKEVGKGTGQGLAIAHSVVVDKHNGILTFESEIGKGTTFIIKLPC